MDSIIWPEAWVGDKYQPERLGLRILIVGESHYGSPDDSSDSLLTKRIVEERKEALWHARFFGIIEQIIIGHRPVIAEIKEFWRRVSFLNYAPVVVTDGTSASDRHFQGAQKRLQQNVVELEPDLVCFFSANAWARRPWGGPDWNQEVFGLEPKNISDSATLYPFKKRHVLMVRFNHPRSLGAPIDVWQSWYKTSALRAMEARQQS